MKKSLLLTLLAFTFLVFQNESLAQSEKVNESFSGIEKIDLDLSIGSVKISPSSSNEVQVKGFFNGEELKVKVWKEGSKLSVLEKTKDRKKGKSESRWELMVPNGLDIDANLGTGDASIDAVSGDFDGNSGTGSLTVDKVEGELEWNSGTGDYIITHYSGEASLNTGTGNFTFAQVGGELSLNTGTGRIELADCRGEISANSGTGEVMAVGLIVSDDSNFNSGTGDVSIQLGASTESDLSVNSGTGDAELDFNGHSFSGTLTMVCSEDKGKIIAPFKFDESWTEGTGRSKSLHKLKKFGSENKDIKVSTGTGKAKVVK